MFSEDFRRHFIRPFVPLAPLSRAFCKVRAVSRAEKRARGGRNSQWGGWGGVWHRARARRRPVASQVRWGIGSARCAARKPQWCGWGGVWRRMSPNRDFWRNFGTQRQNVHAFWRQPLAWERLDRFLVGVLFSAAFWFARDREAHQDRLATRAADLSFQSHCRQLNQRAL